MNKQSVFVYGTLRRGGSNHHRMAGAEWMGKGTLAGALYLIDLNPELSFPALVEDEGRSVVGELYLVPDETLMDLDRYEGVSETPDPRDEYLRVLRLVKMEQGGESLAWVWLWNRELGNARLIESGDWLDIEPDPS